MIRILCAAYIFLCSAAFAHAQGWDNTRVAEMLVSELSPTGAMEAGQWFISTPELATGTWGLGVIYAHIPGSAGSVSIHAGVFQWSGTGWNRIHTVTGLFGMSPKDAAFYPDRVELTTITLGENDARCCPSLEKRWQISLDTGTASPLN